jgi:hypothetical protein
MSRMKARFVHIQGDLPSKYAQAIAAAINAWHEEKEEGPSFYRLMLGPGWQTYMLPAKRR